MIPGGSRMCESCSTRIFAATIRKGARVPAGPLISVIDDDDSVRSAVVSLVRSAGYNAQGFASAEEFLGCGIVQSFACIITDIQMPGMSGLELARTVRDRSPHFPVIVMTAFEPVESEHVTLWLPKQYLFPNLLEKIRYCLTGAKQESAKT